MKDDIAEEEKTFNYDTNLKADKNRAFLDPNHTHFLLVDNARLNKFGGEIEFRGELEKAIVNYVPRKKSKSEIRSQESIPIVVLVLEGLQI